MPTTLTQFLKWFRTSKFYMDKGGYYFRGIPCFPGQQGDETDVYTTIDTIVAQVGEDAADRVHLLEIKALKERVADLEAEVKYLGEMNRENLDKQTNITRYEGRNGNVGPGY